MSRELAAVRLIYDCFIAGNHEGVTMGLLLHPAHTWDGDPKLEFKTFEGSDTIFEYDPVKRKAIENASKFLYRASILQCSTNFYYWGRTHCIEKQCASHDIYQTSTHVNRSQGQSSCDSKSGFEGVFDLVKLYSVDSCTSYMHTKNVYTRQVWRQSSTFCKTRSNDASLL